MEIQQEAEHVIVEAALEEEVETGEVEAMIVEKEEVIVDLEVVVIKVDVHIVDQIETLHQAVKVKEAIYVIIVTNQVILPEIVRTNH